MNDLLEVQRQIKMLRGNLHAFNCVVTAFASCTFDLEQKQMFVKVLAEFKDSLGDGILNRDGIPTDKATAFQKGVIEVLNNAGSIVQGNPRTAHWSL